MIRRLLLLGSMFSCTADTDIRDLDNPVEMRDTAYISPEGRPYAACSQVDPCSSYARALATGAHVLRVGPGTIDESVTIPDRVVVSILAEQGAVLAATQDPIALAVTGAGAAVEVHGLEISGRSSAIVGGGDNQLIVLDNVRIVRNPGIGISINSGMLTLVNSEISDNGTGLEIFEASFRVSDNNFSRNGTSATSFGAVSILLPLGGSNQFSGNTFRENAAAPGYPSAMVCYSELQALTGNVFTDNQIPEIDGDCIFH